MPVYAYYCAANGETVEVAHSMKEDLTTWGEVCARADVPVQDTDPEAEVERILYAPGLSMPAGNSKLKEMGFTKLVRREKGVYENVTALDGEKRYMRADDPSSVPDIKKRIRD
ncbi:MAG: zinc ribbon domain-containing protein [Deltaproteobacteria bacterium]